MLPGAVGIELYRLYRLQASQSGWWKSLPGRGSTKALGGRKPELFEESEYK